MTRPDHGPRKAYEAKTLRTALRGLDPETRQTVLRIAKTRLRPFFKDPRAMVVLRQEAGR